MDRVDVLAIGAHPDDADLGVGGTLRALATAGYRTAILDLTRGELGSRGTPEERLVEAKNAAELLGVVERRNANLPDGGLQNVSEQRAAIIDTIRTLRPKVLLHHAAPDRHPDHRVAAELTVDANFYAGVASIPGGDAYRAAHLLGYRPYHESGAGATFVFDISAVFEQKREALAAYRSQFYNPDYEGPDTYISSKRFWDSIEERAAYWGAQIGVDFGEPIVAVGAVRLDTLPGLGAVT